MITTLQEPFKQQWFDAKGKGITAFWPLVYMKMVFWQLKTENF